MKPQNEIRLIWVEMKALKRMQEDGAFSYDMPLYEELSAKYEEIETLFGHESTLTKAVIYYLDTKK